MRVFGFLILVFGFLVQGCAVEVPIDAYQERLTDYPTHRAHSKVVIFIPETVSESSFGQQGLLALGPLVDWQMAAGDALAQSSKNFFENYFTNVEVRYDTYERGECGDCALAVKPVIEDLGVNKVTMQSKVDMVFDIYDSAGAKILHLPITGRSKLLSLDRLGVGLATAALPVPGVSTLAGNRVLSNSVEDAFEDAFWRLHLEMKDHTQAGALARNWLPRELRKKDNYGRYEFAAERAIKTVGCEFPQDGLRLVETGIEELYEAYCWQQDPFLVSCNGASCELIFSDPDETAFALE